MKIPTIVSPLLILSMASFAYSPCAEALPFHFHHYEAHYTLRYDGIPFGKSTTTLKLKNSSHYQLCIINKTTLPFLHGIVTECSNGIITHQTIKPLHYDYDYHRGSTQEHIHIDFDWQKHTATMTTNQSKNSQWHITIPNNTQDKISYQLVLRRGLANHQTHFSFPIADGGKLKTYEFNVVEQHNNTVKIRRAPMPNKEEITLWFRSDWNYLITKVKQNKHIADIGTADLNSVTWS